MLDFSQKWCILITIRQDRNLLGGMVLVLPYFFWINTDKEVLFDKKVKFRALQPWEKGYIKEDIVKDGFKHIAITEV